MLKEREQKGELGRGKQALFLSGGKERKTPYMWKEGLPARGGRRGSYPQRRGVIHKYRAVIHNTGRVFKKERS